MINKSLEAIQQLVLDIIKVERNHFIPETDRHENVAEHSLSIAILSWKVFDLVRPPLDLEKIFKYALIHDVLERRQSKDVNTYAPKGERDLKKDREAQESKKLVSEFEDFKNFTIILRDYEHRTDGESLFVWTVDKMQQIILGQMDNWRPYISYGVTYDHFVQKNEEFLNNCSPYLKEIFKSSCKTYYDNPAVKSPSVKNSL